MPLDHAAIYEFRLTSTFGYTETRRRPHPPTRGHEQLVAAREAGGVAKEAEKQAKALEREMEAQAEAAAKEKKKEIVDIVAKSKHCLGFLYSEGD